ncbi:MAG TPA: cell division protein ZipA C-terminal FtsZ-binding domain-containing protein [Steroidobacteraceae bacterium]|nr:cell division protein ZipA C-terminal FtsZ-binding domain-containing protein [Steroidobacteraceae bacterium]
MSELRWTLLILGVVFILALTWWERRRPRQAFAPRLREAGLSYGEAQRTGTASSAAAGEPWIGDVGFSGVALPEVSFTQSDDEGVPADDEVMHAHAEPPAHGPLEELPVLVIPDHDERLALRAALEEEQPEPRLIDPHASAAGEILAEASPAADSRAADSAAMDAAALDAAALDAAIPEAPIAPIPQSLGPQPTKGEEVLSPSATAAAPRSAVEPEIPGAEGVGSVRVVEPVQLAEVAATPEPLVEWPPEDSRRILALRVVAAQPERFSGRTLRLALSAEGFLLGKFSIFHKPDEANRALLSAASLNRPGAFDLETMDSQRYSGLSLFAVLPGSRTPRQAFEELLATARNLNERLEGALQDERGSPLTPLRVAGIREGLKAEGQVPAARAHGA